MTGRGLGGTGSNQEGLDKHWEGAGGNWEALVPLGEPEKSTRTFSSSILGALGGDTGGTGRLGESIGHHSWWVTCPLMAP